ncbi:MAG: YafY family transcriptional regulator [Sphingobacteriales bacterium]|nr:YafY family transcriptional regulator [Sphingobacteriales bacterium]MBI3720296.1 YafY family transcriptional regulator [Sphingobacteriales bacterium]
MNRMDRLLGILTILQSKKYVPAEKIADKYNISLRTVYRDIKALTELGIPVSFEQPRGYFIVQGYFLPPVAFTTEEANALVLSELLVYGFADKSIQKHYATALNKVKAVLRSSQKEKVDELDNSIRIQMHPKLLMNVDHLSQIQNAITHQFIVELEYKDKKEEISKRKLEPIGLIYYAFSWHVMGWCHLRKDYRDFKVGRITRLKVTEQPFKKENHISINEFMKQLPVDY